MSYATLKNVWAVKADFFYKTTSLSTSNFCYFLYTMSYMIAYKPTYLLTRSNMHFSCPICIIFCCIQDGIKFPYIYIGEHEVNIGSVGEECELQPSQSPHKKQKK